MSTCFHWYSRIARYSGGHAQVTQFGILSLFEPPGQPEKVMTTSVPRTGASLTAFTKSR